MQGNDDGTPSKPKPPLGESSRRVLSQRGAKGLAKRRGVSAKTIYRRLYEAGLGVRDLRDEERKESIEKLLEAGLPFREIASRLELSGPQAFTRLVRRLFGATPREVRKRKGDEPRV